MRESRARRGLVDTSVMIELERVDPESLPIELTISAMTLAELAAGPHATAPGSVWNWRSYSER